MKISLFLGAGASASFDKPTTIAFKNRLYDKIKPDDILYWFLNHYEYNDVEEILQAIRDTKNFWGGYAGKFLSKPEAKLFVRYNTGEISFNDFLAGLVDLEKIIYNEVFDAYRWNFKDDNNLEAIFSQILAFLKTYSEKVVIFTTNYDRAIEEYCGRIDEKYHCVDGFSLDKKLKRFIWDDKYSPSNEKDVTDVYLYKLHGSLNWKEQEVSGDRLIEKTSEESRSTDTNFTDNILIFPTLYSKERSQLEPFRDILGHFKEYMKSEADICIVIGFSFRDEHLKEIFRSFIGSEKKLIIISPNANSNYHDNIVVDVIQKSDGRTEKREHLFWSGTKSGKRIAINKPDHVYLIEKNLVPENVKEIIHDIKRIMEPEKHPF